MKYKVYIDGQEGTTGLQLQKRLLCHPDIQLLKIDADKRRDIVLRKQLINSADVAFLCLPDDGAREAVQLVENAHTVVIDASTAHRTDAGWDYGFPELSPSHRVALSHSKRIANPGCHATGFLSIVYPLIKAGLMKPDYAVTCHSITGYSGGGKKMIEAYEAADRDGHLASPRAYGLNLQHKHLPEMMAISGLHHEPSFHPIVCDFYSGMAVTVPIALEGIGIKALEATLKNHYSKEPLIGVETIPSDGFLPANLLSGTNRLNLYVYGNNTQMAVTALLDNLGKGAAGAAVQNMNIALGFEETRTLI